jgi:CubicO group peptidase (beta-lactamase class C family)
VGAAGHGGRRLLEPGQPPVRAGAAAGRLNGRAVDFAFWAQGNHGQFIYVAPSRNLVLVRFGINYDYDHWPELLAALARRL